MSTRQLTVLQVLPALNSGGVEKGVLEVANALVHKGHKSLVMSEGGRLVQQLIDDGSEHFNWSIGKKSLLTFLLIPKLRRFLVEHRVDIVHVRSRLPAWLVYLAWRGMDKATRPRFVTTVHGFYSVSWYSAIMTKGEKVIAVSESVKDYILKNYTNVDEDKIKVIHRGIDRDEYLFGFKPESSWLANWYEQYPQLKGKKVVTLPGRVTRL